MTSPFTTVTPQDQANADVDYIPMGRCRSKLMIVRPTRYQREGFLTKHKPEGTDVVFCDIAVLDEIPPFTNEYGDILKGFPAGQQFRNQAVLQGYLKGTFKRYEGQTLIGTIYFGVPEKGKPPMMWQDLSQDPQCVQRGQAFLAQNQSFLVPVEAQFQNSTPVPTGPQPYVQPVSAQPAAVPAPYQQPDPHAQQPAPQQKPAMSTLESMRQMAAQGGYSHDTNVPF